MRRKHSIWVTAIISAVCLCSFIFMACTPEPHTHEWGGWQTTKAATCIVAGEKSRECSDCGEKETEAIAATGHTPSSAWTSDAASHWHECGNCDVKLSSAAHTFGNWSVTPADCETDGSQTRSCTVCAKTETETIDAEGHSPLSAWTSDADSHWHECEDCDEKLSSAAHTFGNWSVTPAECETDGSQTRSCTVCAKTETETIGATDHNWSGWTVTEAADCENDGSRFRTCANCLETDTDIILSPGHDIEWESDEYGHSQKCKVCEDESEGAHNFEQGFCTECGYEMPAGTRLASNRIEAEDFDDRNKGFYTANEGPEAANRIIINYIQNNHYTVYKNVYFTATPDAAAICHAGTGSPVTTLRLDSADGPILAQATLAPSGDWGFYNTTTIMTVYEGDLAGTYHDVYLCMNDGANYDYFDFIFRVSTIYPGRVEAEDHSGMVGDDIRVESGGADCRNLGYTDTGDYAAYKNLFFTDTPSTVTVRYAVNGTAKVALRLGGADDSFYTIAEIVLDSTGVWTNFMTKTADVVFESDIDWTYQDIYLCFIENAVNVDYFEFGL